LTLLIAVLGLLIGGVLGFGAGFYYGEKYFREKYVDMRK
jgi:membrane protein DedA with SNARE-associated domain